MRYLSIITVVVLFCSLASCSKYPEGPGISFRDEKSRAANSWGIKSYQINGVEQVKLTEFATQKQLWLKDGNYSETHINATTGQSVLRTGTWELFDDAKKVKVVYADPSNAQAITTNVFNILMLKSDEIWLRTDDNSLELHMVTTK